MHLNLSEINNNKIYIQYKGNLYIIETVYTRIFDLIYTDKELKQNLHEIIFILTMYDSL